jgi:hypothetical protein
MLSRFDSGKIGYPATDDQKALRGVEGMERPSQSEALRLSSLAPPAGDLAAGRRGDDELDVGRRPEQRHHRSDERT